jgi:hypothetical protein
MPEPSLSELTNIRVDPELGTGAPAVVLNNSDLVRTINDNAQFKAQNDWKRYVQFQGNLKDVFQNVEDIASIEVMEQDRPELKKRLGDALNKIQSNPHAFFSGTGADFIEISKDLAKIRSDSVASKQNNVFDKAHREYILRDPSLNTEENKRIIDNYSKQPLGKRQPYLLNLPGMFDPATIGKQLNEITKTVKPYTKYIDNGNFIESGTETTYDADKWNKAAETLYNMQDDRGNLLRNTVQQRFQNLPKEVQAEYADQPDPAKAFYLSSLEPFRLKDAVTDKQAPKPNPFRLQEQKAKDELDKLRQKHNYDVSLEAMKIGGAKEVAKLKSTLTGKTKNQQYGYLNNLVNEQVYSAIRPDNLVTDPLGGPIPKYEMQVSPPVLHTFGYSTGSGIMKESHDADAMYTDADGKNVTVIFYKRNKDGNIIREGGDPVIDKDKTKQFSKSEYKGIVGKELLGVSGSLKSVNAPDDDEDSDTEEDQGEDSSAPPAPPPVDIKALQKRYNY